MFTYHPYGENALIVRNGEPNNDNLLQLKGALETVKDEMEILALVAGISDLTILFNQERTSVQKLVKSIQKKKLDFDQKIASNRLLKIPVCYHPDFGINLKQVSEHLNLKDKLVIDRHISRKYEVRMMGFLPGFPYLKSNHNALNIKRLKSPNKRITLGSVGLADDMCGVYPSESPGGWNIIGRTPLKLIRSKEPFPFLFRAGDEVQFYEIDRSEFEAISTKELVDKYDINQHIEQS